MVRSARLALDALRSLPDDTTRVEPSATIDRSRIAATGKRSLREKQPNGSLCEGLRMPAIHVVPGAGAGVRNPSQNATSE
ncbi:hypothetical protein MES5069_460029 [Mesorhizobium escarrei]|uniref:Uncharacterized protein n=1 Tax=Mesorhizobium escarrei TaxID=666018 RepID=A0ABM9E8Y2_9HYPH|nr:hypothetical protein MES5069_460029 [Mesorhizobium escarrei]